ncbi:MAG TPA: mechanosensitive ion channel [Bacteroidales bacterium]|nr:mechanosensitive ion channel [Bacteroidales bacterium]HPF01968.1 mechanosensitive ion channel [Bacteroidales bacterium]HPJ60211.1 mechanosensitive ion channel [Bacteroidales bacterium]HPR12273.1 mechanosensitive ion channel [Bacteroidales bacterium]HRW83876.1 mechanosensitive ion channel [Bacteroidales bacterium]
MDTIKQILEYIILRLGNFELKVSTLLLVILIFVSTRILLWIIRKAIFRKGLVKRMEASNAYSFYQIIKYVFWIIAVLFIMQTLGISITVLLAGSAALLVGIGLGLQQTFNDFISGIILLLEGSTKIGDVLEIDGEVVRIEEIGIRTSKGLTRDDIVVIIPNSMITTNKVINWSHQTKKTRFRINIGVAYGSDVDLVIRILEASALEHPEISDKQKIEARLIDFGNSSLDFQLLFFSDNVFRIERIKSDIRKIINRKFDENNIVIPFPQLDLHVKQPGGSNRP